MKLFIFLLLNIEVSLYILDITPLKHIGFANILPRSGGYLFILLIEASEEQMLLILIKYNLSVSFLKVCTFGIILRKPLPNLRLQR